jgi:glycosyltransferase involved in cell wall biosynthesis
MPAIAILLPVRNAQPYLGACLASLWRQTHRDFQVIAVDDGSTDGSSNALARAAARDPRLTVIHTPPLGLPAALNTALAHSRAPLVARQDADDLSHRRRLELLSAYLRDQPRVAVVGSRLRLFPSAMTGVGMRRWAAWHNALLTHDEMANEALIDSPLAHGTAMIRTRWLEKIGGWTDRSWAEDLDLWLRLLAAGARFAKRAEVLYGWRQHRGSATHHDPRYHVDRFLALKLDALGRGFLSGARAVTVVGVGASLARWGTALATFGAVREVVARRPTRGIIESLEPPVVLVYGAAVARKRWREALGDSGMTEQRGFIFVA